MIIYCGNFIIFTYVINKENFMYKNMIMLFLICIIAIICFGCSKTSETNKVLDPLPDSNNSIANTYSTDSKITNSSKPESNNFDCKSDNQSKKDKLSKPKFTPANRYCVQTYQQTFKNGKLVIQEKLFSEDKNSNIYYSINKNDPQKNGNIYKKPFAVQLNGSYGTIVRAINTKKNFLSSDIVERKYIELLATDHRAFKGIILDDIKKGTRYIKGTIKEQDCYKKFNLSILIKLIVKNNSKSINYTTDVHNGSWKIKLDKPLEENDKISVFAETKECIIFFTDKVEKDIKEPNTVYINVDSPKWIPIRKEID